MFSSSVLGQMLVGQLGWPMLVGLVIGLSSKSMCSSASVVMVFNSPFLGEGFSIVTWSERGL